MVFTECYLYKEGSGVIPSYGGRKNYESNLLCKNRSESETRH